MCDAWWSLQSQIVEMHLSGFILTLQEEFIISTDVTVKYIYMHLVLFKSNVKLVTNENREKLVFPNGWVYLI